MKNNNKNIKMFIIKIPAVPVNCTKDFDDKKTIPHLLHFGSVFDSLFLL